MGFPAMVSAYTGFAADWTDYYASQAVAAVCWGGYVLFAYQGTLCAFQVDTSNPDSPQLSPTPAPPGTPPAIAPDPIGPDVYWAAAAVLSGTPYFAFLVFARAPGTETLSYSSFQVATASLAPPSGTSTQDVVQFDAAPLATPPDLTLNGRLVAPLGSSPRFFNAFACAVGPDLSGGGEAIYYFVSVEGLPGLYYFTTSDGTNFSPLAPLPDPVGSQLAAYTFVTLSATSVLLGSDGSGIAVGGFTVDASGTLGVQVFAFSLSDLAAGSTAPYLQQYDLSEACSIASWSYATYIPNPSLALCWGPSPTDSGAGSGNTLTAVLVWTVPDGQELETSIGYMQLDLVEPLASESAMSLGTASTGYSNAAGAFPFTFQSAAGYQPGGGGATYAGGQYVTLFTTSNQSFSDGGLLFAWFLPSLLYSQGSETTYPMTCDGSLNADTTAATVASWGLLGVVTGLPPFDSTGVASAAQVYLSVGYGTGETQSVQVSSQTSILVGGGVPLISAQANWVWTSQSSSSTTWSLSFQETIYPVDTESGALLPDWNQRGALVVMVPTYKVAQYELYSWSSPPADLGLSMYLLWTAGGSVQVFPFVLTDPSETGLFSDTGPAPLYLFPTTAGGGPAVTWSATDDLPGWSDSPPATVLNGVKPLAATGGLQTISVNTATAFNETLDLSQVQSQICSTQNSIGLTPSVSLFGLSFNGGLTLQQTQQVETDFNQSVSIAVSYPQLVSGYIDIQPLLYQADASSLPWVPTPLAGQRPWLLTWQVTDATGSGGQGTTGEGQGA